MNGSLYVVVVLFGTMTLTDLASIHAITSHNKATMKQAYEHVLTLKDATDSFRSYMSMLKKIYGYQRTAESEQNDIASTWLTLEFNATGSSPTDLVPVSTVIQVKDNYRMYLKQTYPEYFSKNNREISIPRHLAEKRLRLFALKKLHQRQRRMALRRWENIKHRVVIPMLDAASFSDEIGVISISPDDFQRIFEKVSAETNELGHPGNVGRAARCVR